MVERSHKHKGVERSNGTLRLHPVSRKHKNLVVSKLHKLEMSQTNFPKIKKSTSKSKQHVDEEHIKELNESIDSITTEVDNDGFIFVDLTKSEAKGLRVKFERTEGRKKRTVGLEITK